MQPSDLASVDRQKTQWVVLSQVLLVRDRKLAQVVQRTNIARLNAVFGERLLIERNVGHALQRGLQAGELSLLDFFAGKSFCRIKKNVVIG